MSASLALPLGGSAPSMPPACAVLRPLVRMVAESIKQFGARETARMCFSIGDGLFDAALEMRIDGRGPSPVVAAEDIEAMASWLWQRSLELSGSVQ